MIQSDFTKRSQSGGPGQYFVLGLVFFLVCKPIAWASWDWSDEKSKKQEVQELKHPKQSVVTEVAPEPAKPAPPPVIPPPVSKPVSKPVVTPTPVAPPVVTAPPIAAPPPVSKSVATPPKTAPVPASSPVPVPTPVSTTAAAAAPPAKISPAEGKTLLAEFVRSQNTELQALVHRELIDETARDDEERAKKNEYLAREKRKREEFLAQEKAPDKRKVYETQERKAREDFFAQVSNEMSARKKSFADQKSVLQNSQKEALAKFKDFLAKGERPPVTLWPK